MKLWIWDLLVREGYDGSYCSVRRYQARWRKEVKAAAGDGGTAFVPLLFAPGRGVPVRLRATRMWMFDQPADAGEGGPHAPVRVAGDLFAGLSARDPGDGVRRPPAGLREQLRRRATCRASTITRRPPTDAVFVGKDQVFNRRFLPVADR